MHLAAIMNQSPAIHWLLEFGADVDIPDVHGKKRGNERIDKGEVNLPTITLFKSNTINNNHLNKI